MNNFQKIKTIYKYLGWDYYGWNAPDKPVEMNIGYFVPEVAKIYTHKLNIHRSLKNNPDWDFIIRLANLLNYTLYRSPYTVDKSVDEMYQFVLKMKG
jgi:hypothetical protein